MEITVSEPVAEKVLDSCLGSDSRRYYKIQWQATWESEDDVLVKYQQLVDKYWKEAESEVTEIEAGRTLFRTLFDKLTESDVKKAPQRDKIVNSPEHKVTEKPPPSNNYDKKPPPLMPEKQSEQERPYQCDECLRSYTTEKKLKDHKRKLHANQGTYQCTLCPKQFPNKRNLQMHLNRHTGIGPHQCPGCSKRFMTPQELQNHKRSCNNLVDKDFQCEVCSKRFSTKTHLQFHMKIHLPDEEKPFKCQYCPRTFAYNHDCVHHMRLHIGEKPFKCTRCDAAFHRKSYLTEHMFIHTGISKYRCQECQQYFKTQQMLQTHVKNIHILKKTPLTEEEKLSRKKKKKKIRYKCEECNKEFRFMKEFHYHQVVNHKEAIQKKIDNVEFTDFEPTMVYKCKKCEKTFQWPSALKKHAETHKYDDLVDQYIEIVESQTEETPVVKMDETPEHQQASNQTLDNENHVTCLNIEKQGNTVVCFVTHSEDTNDIINAGDTSYTEENQKKSVKDYYTCGHCFRVFNNENDLNHHVLGEHQKQTLEESEEVSENEQEQEDGDLLDLSQNEATDNEETEPAFQ